MKVYIYIISISIFTHISNKDMYNDIDTSRYTHVGFVTNILHFVSVISDYTYKSVLMLVDLEIHSMNRPSCISVKAPG